MKINEIYKVRDVAGEHMIVSQGRVNADMTRVVSLNDTAFWLWNKLSDREFTTEDAAELLQTTYGIAHEQAVADAQRWVDRLIECNVIDV